LNGQDPFFSRPDKTLYNNPAFSIINLDGQDSKGSIQLTYRDQWNKISNAAFRTASLEGNLRIYESSLDCWNIGVIILDDRSNNAILRTNNFLASTAYTRKFSQNRTRSNIITVGASMGYNSTNVSLDELWFGRQYDVDNLEISQTTSNGETTILDNKKYFSINAGARWIANLNSKNKEIASLAAHHLNNPIDGFNQENTSLASRIFASINYGGQLSRYLSQDFGISYTQQLNSFQLNPNCQLTYALPDTDDISVMLALSSRIANSINGVLFDAIIPSIGIKSTDWKGLLSYDINISSLSQTSPNAGALELTLAYYLKT